MTADLVAFIRDHLDDDEATARDATPGPWHADGGTAYTTHITNEVVRYTQDSAAHIARHDPARVLAEIDAKRRIVDVYAPAKPRALPHREPGCLTCTTAQAWDATAGEANCETLRLLALPYADHPDYREDWRP